MWNGAAPCEHSNEPFQRKRSRGRRCRAARLEALADRPEIDGGSAVKMRVHRRRGEESVTRATVDGLSGILHKIAPAHGGRDGRRLRAPGRGPRAAYARAHRDLKRRWPFAITRRALLRVPDVFACRQPRPPVVTGSSAACNPLRPGSAASSTSRVGRAD